jgi:hypothetical protein
LDFGTFRRRYFLQKVNIGYASNRREQWPLAVLGTPDVGQNQPSIHSCHGMHLLENGLGGEGACFRRQVVDGRELFSTVLELLPKHQLLSPFSQ